MNKSPKKVKIGIMPKKEFQQYTIDIAKGKRKRKAGEPKIWFHSIKSLANILSEDNQKLLSLIISENPQSISELELLTGRKPNNILRTLRTMEHYGFVELIESKEKNSGRAPLIPRVLYSVADIEVRF
jgi:predicted transcriptional regulator